MIADDIIVVGDPERVQKISRHFDKSLYQVNNRVVTHTGEIGGKKLSVSVLAWVQIMSNCF